MYSSPTTDDNAPLSSGVYKGVVFHKRFLPKINQFSYQISMLGIVLDELEQVTSQHTLLGTQWFNPIRFNEKDYIRSEPGSLKQRIVNKVKKLGGEWDEHKVLMIVQCRCLGLYFSPINLYYCFDKNDQCKYMLAEVSNTPWNERHYYLVDVPLKQSEKATDNAKNICKKDFHVSPFMELNMNYHWNVNRPDNNLHINIQNFTPDNSSKVFEANMSLRKKPLKTLTLLKSWLSLPFTIIKIVSLIYWQALKLLIKRIPIVDKAK